jgi:hypothetical protein
MRSDIAILLFLGGLQGLSFVVWYPLFVNQRAIKRLVGLVALSVGSSALLITSGYYLIKSVLT